MTSMITTRSIATRGITILGAQWMLVALASMLLTAQPVQAQFSPPQANDSLQRRAEIKVPSAPPARAPDKLHAFTGPWANDDFLPAIVAKGAIPLDDEHEAMRAKLEKDRKAGVALDGNEPKCIPNGPVMSMAIASPPGMFTATATELTIVADRLTRHIMIDKQHTPDNLLFDSYAGESVAHWEGKDLVVDTIAVKPEVEIDWGIPLGARSKFHMVERFRLVGPSKMEIETVINDPGVLTKPWKFTRRFTRSAEPEEENYCITALDRDRDPATGEPGLDLTPPPNDSSRYIPPGADK